MGYVFPILAAAAHIAFVAHAGLPKDGATTPASYNDISLVMPAVATVLYLAMCYFGPKMMAKRAPFELKGEMQVYNLYETVYNIVNVALFVMEVRRLGMSVWGTVWECGADQRANYLLFGVWMHYTNKYIELLDTVFMVLRKKNQQLSFLHMYHHTLLIWSWAFVCKMPCCADSYFGACVNSFIHIIMYSYYFMALLKIKCPWKKYITQAQMLQFLTCAAHSFYILYFGTCPPSLPLLQLFVMVNMFVLFAQFYMKAYASKKAAKTS